jgi:Family of unknown function (DUF5681)
MTMSKKAIPQSTSNQIKHDINFGAGYGQPPRHSQFKKGQSGNAMGRPRKDKSPSAAAVSPSEGSNAATMSRVLAEDVTVTRKGKRRKISKAEFVQRASEKQIVDGSYYAMRDAKAELREADARRELDIAEDHAFWSDYLVRREADIEATSAKGLPPSRFWIEPEDIIIREGERVHIRGPVLQKEVRGFELMAQQFKIRMVEWRGRLIFGRERDDLNDMDISTTLACITWGLPHRLRKSCMATWDELTALSSLFGRHYDDLR